MHMRQLVTFGSLCIDLIVHPYCGVKNVTHTGCTTDLNGHAGIGCPTPDDIDINCDLGLDEAEYFEHGDTRVLVHNFKVHL